MAYAAIGKTKKKVFTHLAAKAAEEKEEAERSATIAKALDISQETVPKARAKEKKVGTEAKVKEKTRKQDFKAHTKKEKEKVGRVRPPGAGYVEAVTMQQTASKAKA